MKVEYFGEVKVIGSTCRLVLFAIVLGSFAIGGGAAKEKLKSVKISGNHSAGEIQATCASVGAEFSPHEDGKGYGCSKQCKGGTCSVACTTDPPPARNCTGVVPIAMHVKPPISGTTRIEQVLMAFETKGYQPTVKQE